MKNIAVVGAGITGICTSFFLQLAEDLPGNPGVNLKNKITRSKKERFATVRQAKLRLSNIKIEELNLIMKNKSKIIKH